MRYASLGSGSKGNATLVSSGTTTVLVDCGFAAREAIARMERLGFDPAELDAVVVTHEHGDHGKGVRALCRKLDIPAYMSAGTAIGLKCHEDPHVRLIDTHASFQLGSFEIIPIIVPHDARETCQFVFAASGRRLGVLTDLGHITPYIAEAYRDLDALILEANHDPVMLAEGPYPASLKRRVGGRFGHLSNEQSADLLRQLNMDRLQQIVIAHISEQNNDPERAAAVLAAAIPGHEHKLRISTQDAGFDWCAVNSRIEDTA
ncbi:MAG: MBL fold metallo-hydrolase [Natronospirillum sp.]|uniref:MBL fold metallo-hydrolase n=1 Tax=Natronospirillum sp. TaxID=2812955 RepID=UPI0025F75D94|nr:MBL fold metallo-hydrolase [Natronospirillum sp.]MCH8552228.1 MBL fold metallo-hydrolase [Natronospirillum sp.]